LCIQIFYDADLADIWKDDWIFMFTPNYIEIWEDAIKIAEMEIGTYYNSSKYNFFLFSKK